MLNGSTIASDHALKRAMSSRGTPIWSAMIIIGSGWAKSRTNSQEPRAAKPSMSSLAMRSMYGVISRTLPTVNSRSSRRRTQVCRGGSEVEHDAVGSQPPFTYVSMTACGTPPGLSAMGLTPLANRSGWRITSRASSNDVTRWKPVPGIR